MEKDRETKDPTKRFRVGPPAIGMPMWAVLDDEVRAAIALAWHEEEAKRIVDAMNEAYTVRKPYEAPTVTPLGGTRRNTLR